MRGTGRQEELFVQWQLSLRKLPDSWYLDLIFVRKCLPTDTLYVTSVYTPGDMHPDL